MADELVLEMRGIRKEFPGIVANDDVDFDVRRGEVHALLGENGAGKSTLMNILYGLYRPDAGEILLHGKPVDFGSARDAIEAGIGMVHQHFMLIPVMTVAENIVLGMEPRGRRPARRARGGGARARALGAVRARRRPGARSSATITVGQQQRVEILKALYRGADILILDEPTAVLTPQEAHELFGIIRSLHGGREVDHLHQPQAERGARDRRPDHRPAARQEDRDGAARGRDRGVARARDGRPRGAAPGREDAGAARRRRCSRSTDLHVRDDRGIEKVRGVSFDVRAGEIVGIAGVDGNGQTELIEAITGLRKIESGTIDGRRPRAPRTRRAREMLDAGVGHIPEDRQRRGLVLEFTIAENIALHDYAKPPDARWGWLFPARLVERARTADHASSTSAAAAR